MQTWQKSCSVQFDREQSLLKPLDPLRLCAGWLRLRSAHLSSLRQVLPGGPAALLHGGPRHRRRHLLEGEPGAVIMHETVTRRQEFESRRRNNRGIKLQNKLLQTCGAGAGMVWQDISNSPRLVPPGAVHGLHREAAGVQHDCPEELQSEPRGRRLVHTQQRAPRSEKL